MRLAVYGVGAIGGYLTWWLARGEHTVSAIARGEHLAAISSAGLRLEIDGEPGAAVHVHATDAAASLPKQDIVFVTLKHPGLAPAVDGLRALGGPDTTFVFVTNGVPWWMEPDIEVLDPDGELGALIPLDRRVGCVAKASAELRSPGIVSLDTNSARFIVGPADRCGADNARTATEVLATSGIAARFEADLRPAVWDKLFLNVAFSLPAALMDMPVGVVASQPEIRTMLRSLFGELRAIARSRGIEPGISDAALGDTAILGSTHTPSILQDLRRGRPAEIDALVTAPIALARMAGLQTPVLDQLGALVTAKARILGSHDRKGPFVDEK